ncbi:MAG TPA: hypothetical protein P5081_09355 [Phycisphaerae bacterium]|nr:hypothetical protein [Phycisphaerae bacterium]HRW53084.1 hypothetical protein [Phycisphaerae bacterium]
MLSRPGAIRIAFLAMIVVLGLRPMSAEADSVRFLYERVVDSNTPLPQGGGTFRFFSEPAVDAQGNVTFQARDSNFADGIYASRGGVMEVVAEESDLFPGLSTSYVLLSSTPSVENGIVLYQGRSVGSLSDARDSLERRDGASKRVIAISHVTQVPGEPTGVLFGGIGGTSVELQHGATVFSGSWGDPPTYGIFRDDNGTLSALVRQGDMAPNGEPFTLGMGNPAVDANGDGIAFLAHTDSGGFGVFVVENGVISLIADETTLIPGTNVTFTSVNRPSMDNGWVVFSGTGLQDAGLYYFDGAELRTVSDPTTPLPDGGGYAGTVDYAVSDGAVYFDAVGPGGQRLVMWRDGELHKVLGGFGSYLDGVQMVSNDFRLHGVSGDYLAVSVILFDGSRAIYRIKQTPFCAPLAEGAIETPGEATRAAVDDSGLLYIANGSAGLLILDVADASAPISVGAFTETIDAFDVVVRDSIAYVTDQVGALFILDVSAPQTPSLLSAVLTGDSAYEVTVQDGHAFVACGEGGLRIVDVSDPSSPLPPVSLPLPGIAVGVEVVDDVAYVACIESGLQIVDVSDAASPVLRGAYDTPGFAVGVAVSNGVACVADGESGVQLIDVSDPASPTLLSNYPVFDATICVRVVGNVALVTDGNAGAHVVDISDPTEPLTDSVFQSVGFTGGIALNGTAAYLLEDDAGVEIVNFPCLYGCPADLNDDGLINSADIQSFLECYLGAGNRCGRAELDGAPGVGDADIARFVEFLLAGETCP